ncbi:MAG: S8 family serine peptidase [Leptolyngbyaceae cyanobacterium SM2_5_2]|nr:S8 family serine peptidase [Leptolyngbyaceae cyanobacterium SM2_5_2]
MQDENYVVLQRQEVMVPTFDNLGRPPSMTNFSMLPPAALIVQEAALSGAERHDLRRDPRTLAVAPMMPMQLIAPVASEEVEADALASVLWGLQAVGALESDFDGSGITVAVLDTGIDPNHPAFAGVSLVQRNFTTETDNDLNGHGTHCAGTIFGQDVNNTRIGIARNIQRALIGKVLGEGGGSSLSIAQAIQWAVSGGAQVVSMSLGIDFPGYVDFLVNQRGVALQPATSIALEGYRANVNLFTELTRFVETSNLFGQASLLIAAAGNESDRPAYEIAVAPPAAGTGVIAVGALAQGPNGLTVANFSNNQVNIAGPGVNIISAWPGGGLRSLNGTSMATPHVAGVAALWAQQQIQQTGRLDSRLLMARLIASGTTDTLAAADPEDVGAGLVQAPRSL